MSALISRTRSLFKIYGKVIGLLVTMIVGGILPQFNTLSFLIQYLLMAMLFFSFLDIEIKPGSFQKSVVWVLLANLAVAFGSYWVFSFFDINLALASFMTAIAPTAISSPVIISLIERKVEYMVGAVLLTNVSMALVLPLALPYLVGKVVQISVWEVLQPVLVVMFVPLILARLAAWLPSRVRTVVYQGRSFSFPLWLACLFIISAKSADFLRGELAHATFSILAIAAISLAICILNFTLGALLGGRDHRQEASQSLGQKNNSFVIWVALTFINPLVALGPAFYIVYHNLYNSWQIYLFEKRRNA
jgi:BASS family bile acid:Na+ symporter